MEYNIIYMTDISRTVSGIIFDSQYTIPVISNKSGIVIQAYTNGEIAKITSDVIPYKIETEDGSLAGFFTLKTGVLQIALFQFQLRPAFTSFSADISQIIGNFILSNNWNIDILI